MPAARCPLRGWHAAVLAALLALSPGCAVPGSADPGAAVLPADGGGEGLGGRAVGRQAGAGEVTVQDPEAQDPEAQSPDVQGPGEQDLATQEVEGVPEEGLLIEGYLKTRYWARWTSDESDQDLYTALYFDIGDVDNDPVTFHFMGRASADLDGTSNPSEFFNITDTFDSAVNGRLYDAYFDFGNAVSLDVARLGRQQIYETPVLAYFDGLLLQSPAMGASEVQLALYGGIPVALYESSPDDDSMFGAYAQARPWTGGRVRVDYMDMDELYLSQNFDNDLLGLGVWQAIGDQWTVDGQYTMLDWDSNDLRLGTRYYDVEEDFSAQLNYYNLLEAQRALVLELDPFYNSLFDYFPFQQLGVLAAKGLGEHLSLQGGVDIRRVSSSGDIGVNNRDYERYFLTADVREVGWEGFGFSVTADIWESDSRDIDTYGLTLSQELAAEWQLSAGTYYSMWKFDVVSGEERNDVRTFYVTVRHRPSESWILDADFNFEDADPTDYYWLRLGVTWLF